MKIDVSYDARFFLELFFACVVLTVLGLLLPGCAKDVCSDWYSGKLYVSARGNIYACNNAGACGDPRWEWVLLEQATTTASTNAEKPSTNAEKPSTSAEVEPFWRISP